MSKDNQPSIYVVIDLGSSSFHLQALQILSAGPRPLLQMKRKVYLADGLDDNHYLAKEAIDRGLACIRLFADQLRAFNSEFVDVIGTAALRMASNRSDFLKPAQKLLNLPIRVLQGDEEAELIYRGVCATTLLSNKHLVVDIGGASTELIYGEKQNPLARVSMDIGAVTLNKRFFPALKIDVDAYAQALAHAKVIFMQHQSVFSDYHWQHCFAASGIFRSIWKILTYERPLQELTARQIAGLRDKVLLYPSLHELRLPGIDVARHSTLVAGLALLEALIDVFQIKSVSPAQGALREGVLCKFAKIPDAIDVQQILDGLTKQFYLDAPQAQRVMRYAYQVFQHLRRVMNWRLDNQWHDLKILVGLGELGFAFGRSDPARHTAYFFEQSHVAGIDHHLQAKLVSLFKLLSQQVLFDSFVNIPVTWLWIARVAGIVMAACRLRDVQSFPVLQWHVADDQLVLYFESKWAEKHPWGFICLEEEVIRQQRLGFDTQIMPIST